MLSLKSRVVKDEKVPWRMIEDEAVLVDVARGGVVQLNQSAAFVWGSINGEKTVAEIVSSLCEMFEVDSRRAEKDVLEFLKELSKKKIIKLR